MSTQARQKSQEMRRAREAEAQRRKKRQRLFTAIGIVVIVALVAAIIFLIAKAASGGGDTGSSSGAVVAPKNLNSDGGFYVGKADAPVTVTLYYDYMCPACGAFEKANTDELDKLLADNTIRMDLRPIAFLDKASQGTQYSTRAANDFATVIDLAPDKAWAFHEALYANQPEENSTGLTDDKLAEIARSAGVPDSVVAKFTDKTFEPWVAKTTQKAFDSGVTGTPTIKINGKPFQGNPYETGPLTEAIQAAAAQK